MNNRITSLYKNLSIFSFVLMQPSMIVDETLGKFGFSQKLGFFILFCNLFVIALSSFRESNFSNLQKKIIFLFLVIVIYLITLELVVDNSFGISTAIKNFIVAILIIIIINNNHFNIKRLTSLFITIAFILSFLSLLQYISYLLNIYTPGLYTYTTYSPGEKVNMGFGGIIDIYSWGRYYRVQSFFIEPARFAQFLMVPLFLIIYRYIRNSTKSDLFILLIILLAFILTFSVANYFGFLFGLIIFSLLIKRTVSGKKIKIINRMLFIIFGLSILYIGIQFFGYTNKYSYYSQSGNILGKSFTESVVERYDRFNMTTAVVYENFFGNRFERSVLPRNPGALGLLLLVGGVPLALLCLSFSGYFYFSLISLVRKSKYSLIFSGSIGYFIPFNWYGSYYENLFLFQIMLLATYIRCEQQIKTFI